MNSKNIGCEISSTRLFSSVLLVAIAISSGSTKVYGEETSDDSEANQSAANVDQNRMKDFMIDRNGAVYWYAMPGSGEGLTESWHGEVSQTHECTDCHRPDSRMIGMGDAEKYGFRLRAADSVLRRALKLGDDVGVVIQSVAEDSPAAESGFETADVLIKANGKTIGKASEIQELLSDTESESTQFVFLRNGEELKRAFRMGDYRDEVLYRLMIGVGLTEVDAAMRSQLGIPDTVGILVDEVLPGYPAIEAGVQLHDVIVEAGDQTITSGDDIARALRDAKGKAVTFTVIRAAKEHQINITPTREPREAVATYLELYAPLEETDAVLDFSLEGYDMGDFTTATSPVWRTVIPERKDGESEKLDEVLKRLKELEAILKTDK